MQTALRISNSCCRIVAEMHLRSRWVGDYRGRVSGMFGKKFRLAQLQFAVGKKQVNWRTLRVTCFLGGISWNPERKHALLEECCRQPARRSVAESVTFMLAQCLAWILALGRRGTEETITPLRVETYPRNEKSGTV